MTSATILGCEGPRLSPSEAAFFREADPWGFTLFVRNVETPDQLRALMQDLRDTVGRDAVGFDSNCAPVADVATCETHSFLRNRCYGDSAEVVTGLARAASDAMLAGGVVSVIKHMPSHVRALADSHKELPTVTTDAETLRRVYFSPVVALADMPMAMTAHIVLTAFDPEASATQSPEMIRIIREEIGFGGLLISDDLNMQALGSTLSERAEKSVWAGCDIALHYAGVMVEMEVVVAAFGAMTPAAVTRGEVALAMRQRPEAVDTEGAGGGA